MRKIYVVGSSTGYANWMEGQLVGSMADADLVVFTGGEDVDPDIYNEPSNPRTYSNPRRDNYEVAEYDRAFDMGKHMIGICRGAQLLCALNGGRLVQHQPNPESPHMMETYDGKRILITSLHHQAAFPFNLPEEDYEVLGWNVNELSFHQDGEANEMNPTKEVEMIYFPKTKCFGIQGHPEMMNQSSETIVYLRNLLNLFTKDEIPTEATVNED